MLVKPNNGIVVVDNLTGYPCLLAYLRASIVAFTVPINGF